MTAEPSTQQHDRPATLDDLPAADWVSVTRCPYGVARVRTRPGGDTLMVLARGGGQPWPGNWGEVPADGVYELRSGAGYAFTATYEGPATTVHLQTNLAHGVMAVHAFHHFTDGSGRRDYYTREFYVSGGEPRPPRQGGLPEALLDGRTDPGALSGAWEVLDRENMQIERLDYAQTSGGEPGVRAYGAEDSGTDWGRVPVTLYADGADPSGPPAFLATFEREDRRVHVQARDFLGVLVVAQYTEYTDGSGRTDYFTRDCFRR